MNATAFVEISKLVKELANIKSAVAFIGDLIRQGIHALKSETAVPAKSPCAQSLNRIGSALYLALGDTQDKWRARLQQPTRSIILNDTLTNSDLELHLVGNFFSAETIGTRLRSQFRELIRNVSYKPMVAYTILKLKLNNNILFGIPLGLTFGDFKCSLVFLETGWDVLVYVKCQIFQPWAFKLPKIDSLNKQLPEQMFENIWLVKDYMFGFHSRVAVPCCFNWHQTSGRKVLRTSSGLLPTQLRFERCVEGGFAGSPRTKTGLLEENGPNNWNKKPTCYYFFS